MAQFYTLEEAARVLGMGPEELKAKAQHREIRAFMDSGSWRFRVADVDELARRRGLGSDPDFSLSDPELSLSKLDIDSPGPVSESEELNLSEFQLGAARPDLGQPTMDIAAHGTDPEKDVVVDDLSLPSGGNSSSTILGMKSSGKLPSDSDVRLAPSGAKDASDSDVRLAPHMASKAPSDSDVTLVSDDQSVLDFPAKPGPGDTAVRQGPSLGSSAEVAAGSKPGAEDDSDFELTPSSVIDALQPESGSDFELSAIDASDEFDSTPLRGPSDSDVTAAAPADSGINLGKPSDSGINLGGIEGMNFGSADSIELAPISGADIKAAPKAKPKAPEPAKPKPSLAATPPPATRKGEKDIFEDTDFEVDALGSDEADDRTQQIEATSDFDLDESDSASEVFAIDEEDVDESASTAMGPAMLDDESGEFDADEGGGGIASSGWDVDSEPVAPVAAVATSGPMISSRGDSAEWGGLWVGFLGVGTILTLLAAFISIDLMRNLYDYHGAGPASGIINALAGLFPK